MEKVYQQIYEKTGLKHVPTFEELMQEYLSMGPKIEGNPRQATLIYNSMAMSQFIGAASETEDQIKTAMLTQERDEFIRQLAMQHGFHPHDLENAMDTLDPDVDRKPKADSESESSDDDMDVDPKPQRFNIATPKGPRVPPIPSFNKVTRRGLEFDWTSTRGGGPPPGPPPAPFAPKYTTSAPPAFAAPKGGFPQSVATSSSSYPPPPPPRGKATVPLYVPNIAPSVGKAPAPASSSRAPPPPPSPPRGKATVPLGAYYPPGKPPQDPSIMNHVFVQAQNLAQRQQRALDEAQSLLSQTRLETARRHEEERMARLMREQTMQDSFNDTLRKLSGIGAQRDAEMNARMEQMAARTEQIAQATAQMSAQAVAHSTQISAQAAQATQHMSAQAMQHMSNQASAQMSQMSQMSQAAQHTTAQMLQGMHQQTIQTDAKRQQLLQELAEARRQLDLLALGGQQNAHREMEALKRHIAKMEAQNAAFAASISQAIGRASSMFSEGMQAQIEAHQEAVSGLLSALQRLSSMPSQATPTQVTNILNQYNAPQSSHINMLALSIAQGRGDPQALRAILDKEGPTETSETAAMPVMGPDGMSGATRIANTEPLVPIAPDGLPVIDIEGEVLPHVFEPPKGPLQISAPRTKRRMSLKYHKRRAKAVMAVLRGKKSADDAREELARFKRQKDAPEPDDVYVSEYAPVKRRIDKKSEEKRRHNSPPPVVDTVAARRVKNERRAKSPPMEKRAKSPPVMEDIKGKRAKSVEIAEAPEKRRRAQSLQPQRQARPSQAPARPSQAPARPSQARPSRASSRQPRERSRHRSPPV